jgi:hypothetical protein
MIRISLLARWANIHLQMWRILLARWANIHLQMWRIQQFKCTNCNILITNHPNQLLSINKYNAKQLYNTISLTKI